MCVSLAMNILREDDVKKSVRWDSFSTSPEGLRTVVNFMGLRTFFFPPGGCCDTLAGHLQRVVILQDEIYDDAGCRNAVSPLAGRHWGTVAAAAAAGTRPIPFCVLLQWRVVNANSGAPREIMSIPAAGINFVYLQIFLRDSVCVVRGGSVNRHQVKGMF